MKKFLIWLCWVVVFSAAQIGFAADMIIQLQSPQKSAKKLGIVQAIPKEEVVSGTITLDIAPYPANNTAETYSVKYFFAETLVYETNGKSTADPAIFSFAYNLDTTHYVNGEYRLYVNYFDSDGNEAIGAKKIIINNEPLE